MIRSPKELSESINAAINRKAVLFSHVLLSLTITVHTALDSSSTKLDIIAVTFIGIFLVILGILRVFDLAKLNNNPKLYIALYSVVYFFGVSFLTDPSTPYALGFFFIVFIANLYYGARGVWLTVGIFGLTSIVKIIYMSQIQDLDKAGFLNILATFLVFVAMCSIFVNIQKVFEWDRTKMKAVLKESAIEEKRMRALINNMTESVIVLDKEGIIRLYNAAALALFNTNNSLSDKALDSFVSFEDSKGTPIPTTELLPTTTRPVMRNDIVLRYSQEDSASISVIATPIRATFGQDKEEEGYVMTLRDITREKSLEEERDEFISVISHELRTPVTVAEAGISNALLLSSKTEGNEKITKSLQTAHDQAVFLANMLNDLTTFARAEKGTLDMNLEEFMPRDLLDTLVSDYRAGVEAKGMNITTDLDPSTPLTITSNRLYIREILQNFITNAIKYSDKGTITLKARAKDKGILFSVADQGIGISVSDQKKVFEKFFRTEDYRTRSTNGTGLGLYIVKKLAKILDASFEVSSEVGKGSTFSIYVPDKADVLAAKKAADAAPVATTHLATPATVPASPAATPPQPPTQAVSVPVISSSETQS